jgi:hypothetical protein
VISFCNLACYSGVKREWSEGAFDYLELSVLYTDDSSLPSSFGGVSGAGVWQVGLVDFSGVAIGLESPILSGLAFYQTDIIENERSIICHGRVSIYKHIPRVMSSLD